MADAYYVRITSPTYFIEPDGSRVQMARPIWRFQPPNGGTATLSSKTALASGTEVSVTIKSADIDLDESNPDLHERAAGITRTMRLFRHLIVNPSATPKVRLEEP
jgi:hypothetical protein